MYDENEGLLDPYHGYTNNIFDKSSNAYSDFKSNYNRYYDDATRGDISANRNSRARNNDRNRNRPEPLDRGAMMFGNNGGNNGDQYDGGGFEMRGVSSSSGSRGGYDERYDDYCDHPT